SSIAIRQGRPCVAIDRECRPCEAREPGPHNFSQVQTGVSRQPLLVSCAKGDFHDPSGKIALHGPDPHQQRTTGCISRNSDGRLDVKLSPRGGAGIHGRADLTLHQPPSINKGSNTMKQIIDQHRRQFFGVAAGTVAAGLGVIGLARAESEAPRSSATNASFGAIKQIDAGVLNVGYAEAGPANGPVAILLHGWPYDIHAFVDVAPILAKAGYR